MKASYRINAEDECWAIQRGYPSKKTGEIAYHGIAYFPTLGEAALYLLETLTRLRTPKDPSIRDLIATCIESREIVLAAIAGEPTDVESTERAA